jgi:hypothetical protein
MRPGLLLAVLAGCGGGAPELGKLLCQSGDAACQAQTNPQQLSLSVTFDDAEGDVAGGVGRFYVDGQVQRSFAMRPVFLQSGVDLRATSGTLKLTVNLEIPDPVAGTQFDLGFEVVDQAGNVSNRPAITFRIDRP